MTKLEKHSVSVIVVAAGEGRRMRSDVRKPWLVVAGEPVVVHTLARFAALEITREIILVVHPEDVARAEKLSARFKSLRAVAGGSHRVDSVRNGLALAAPDTVLVAIQDGVRPLVTEDVIRRACAAAMETGAAVPVVPVRATLKEVPSGAGARRIVSRTVSRANLYEAQTPQVFRGEVIRRAYEQLKDADITDDAQAVERMGEPVAAVEGDVHNIKLTTPEDLRLAEMLLGRGID